MTSHSEGLSHKNSKSKIKEKQFQTLVIRDIKQAFIHHSIVERTWWIALRIATDFNICIEGGGVDFFSRKSPLQTGRLFVPPRDLSSSWKSALAKTLSSIIKQVSVNATYMI